MSWFSPLAEAPQCADMGDHDPGFGHFRMDFSQSPCQSAATAEPCEPFPRPIYEVAPRSPWRLIGTALTNLQRPAPEADEAPREFWSGNNRHQANICVIFGARERSLAEDPAAPSDPEMLLFDLAIDQVARRYR